MTRSRRTLSLKTRGRTFSLTITEHSDRVEIALTATKYGTFGDEPELQAWLAPIFSHYDTDPRPIVMANQHSGELAVITGDEHDGVAFIQHPTLQ